MNAKSSKDPDGQPNPRFGAARRTDRDVAEMLGIAKGVLADGKIVQEEADCLADWVDAHPDVVHVWPCDVIHARLVKIYSDGLVSDEERRDLAELLQEVVGRKSGSVGGETTPSDLPLDKPVPSVILTGRSFVLTGKFAMGPRDACEKLTTNAGGVCQSNVSKSTQYLVIGTFSSRDWIQTSHGRKIEKAVELRRGGSPIHIVGEDHWAKALEAPQPRPLSHASQTTTDTVPSLKPLAEAARAAFEALGCELIVQERLFRVSIPLSHDDDRVTTSGMGLSISLSQEIQLAYKGRGGYRWRLDISSGSEKIADAELGAAINLMLADVPVIIARHKSGEGWWDGSH